MRTSIMGLNGYLRYLIATSCNCFASAGPQHLYMGNGFGTDLGTHSYVTTALCLPGRLS